MNTKVIGVILGALVLVGLVVLLMSRGPQPAPEPVVDTTVVEEPEPGQTERPEETDEAAEETLEVVEESAAEAEPEDEAIVLAQAAPVEAPVEWQFTEGTHYSRMVPTQPTVGGADKVEVAEFFWYGCPHCSDFEPYINRWDAEKPANARFVKVPISWNALTALHARMYYTAEVLARNGAIDDAKAFHAAAFLEYQRGNRMTSETAIQNLFSRFNVSSDDFNTTWNSFEVDQKLRLANDLMRRYKIDGVPAVVVNGKYRTGGAEAGSYPKLLEVINELIARESLR